MTQKRVLEIDYTGRDSADAKVFDTTRADVAKAAGVFDGRTLYRPLILIENGGELLPALEKTLSQMKAGEKKTLKLEPTEAFGNRNPELVRVVPLKQFQARQINPTPGLDVMIDQYRGRVQSVSGGRVRVDFNHPLAGKTAEFELELKALYETEKDKVQAVFKKFFVSEGENAPVVNITAESCEVALPGLADGRVQQLKQSFANAVFDVTEKIQKVRFVENVERTKPEPAEKAVPAALPKTAKGTP